MPLHGVRPQRSARSRLYRVPCVLGYRASQTSGSGTHGDLVTEGPDDHRRLRVPTLQKSGGRESERDYHARTCVSTKHPPGWDEVIR